MKISGVGSSTQMQTYTKKPAKSANTANSAQNTTPKVDKDGDNDGSTAASAGKPGNIK
ncbi:MAG: hypothetical protein HY280_04000 [Nitrospinae bacterium]|nr:hypothetical protein [Nitrospinota bacterium]